MTDDANHLRLLKIGFYIMSCIAAIFGSFFLIHVTIGIVFLVSPPVDPGGEPFPAEMFGLLFLLIGGAIVLFAWTLATCMFITARSLAARKRYNFCVVVSALSCLYVPLGTVLGVLSLIVLTRQSVKQLFSDQNLLGTGPVVAPQPGAWRS
jgi:hypothetical protein